MELKLILLSKITLSRCYLLIVPYGIETQPLLNYTGQRTLLIVPYGIETKENTSYGEKEKSFNRTLWN